MSSPLDHVPPTSADAARTAPPTSSGPTSDGTTAIGTAAVGPQDRAHSATRRPTRLSSLHVAIVVSVVALVLLVIFLVQNAHTVDISFLGAHLRVSLAVAMLIAAVAGALIVGAVGTARIAQLRRGARRESRSR